jgi:hypothetical protein
MTAQTKATIKTYFETGDIPTQAQFADLADSYEDTGAVSTHNSSATAHGLTTDISAALAAATSPSASNPFVTPTEDPTWTALHTYDRGTMATGNGVIFQTLKHVGADATLSNYHVSMWTTDFDVGKPPTQSLGIGYNMGANLSQINATDATIGFGIEAPYWSSGVEYYEAHIWYQNSSTQMRPITIRVTRSTNKPEIGFQAGRVTFYDTSWNPNMIINEGGDLSVYGATTFLDAVSVFDGKSFRIYNSDETAYGSFYNDGNTHFDEGGAAQLLLFSSWDGVGIIDQLFVFPTLIEARKDLSFNANTIGPILVDTTDGHTYRLRSTNGALVLQQAS